jgi:O-antigen ligase
MAAGVETRSVGIRRRPLAAAVPSLPGDAHLVPAAARALGASSAAAAVAWLVVHGDGRHAAALLAFLPIAAFVMHRKENGVLLGTALIVVLPWWMTLGSSQMKVEVVASVLATTAILFRIGDRRRGRQRFGFLDGAVAAFVTAAVISFIFTGPHTYHSFTALFFYICPIAFYVGAREVAGKSARLVSCTLFIAGTVAAIPLFYEFFVAHRPLFTNGNIYYWQGAGGLFRPGGTFGGAPQAVIALSMTTLCGLGLLIASSRRVRVPLFAALALSITAMVLTFTRAGLIGFAAGALILVAASRRTALGPLLVVLAALGVVAVLVVLPSLAGQSWYNEGVVRHGTFADRETRWRVAWPVITNSPEHFIAGHGVNSLLVGHPTGLSGQPQHDLAAVPILIAVSPHSQYFRALLEQGVIGLTLLLTWLLGSVVQALNRLRSVRDERTRAILAACAAGIVSVLIASLAGDALRDPPTLGIVSILSGLIAGTCHRLNSVTDDH